MTTASHSLLEGVAEPIEIKRAGLDVLFWQYFLDPAESQALAEELLDETPWEQKSLKVYGRRHSLPRLTCWYGDVGAAYVYSGIRNEPHRWTPTLNEIRRRIESATNLAFNSVLLNLYRTGQDYMSWHSDDEPELGAQPFIASLSLGAARRFLLRKKAPRLPGEPVELSLTSGSLLLMRGETQDIWEHSVPKEMRVLKHRINLTFRHVGNSGAAQRST